MNLSFIADKYEQLHCDKSFLMMWCLLDADVNPTVSSGCEVDLADLGRLNLGYLLLWEVAARATSSDRNGRSADYLSLSAFKARKGHI